MKITLKQLLCLFVWLFFIISCRKHDEVVADCISEVTADSMSMANLVTSSQFDFIDSLFSRNSLSTANEQFSYLDSNRYQPPGYNYLVSQVAIVAYLWYNQLPVFMWNNYFIFYDGVLQSSSIIYRGAVPGPDTIFHQSLESLRLIYQSNFSKVIISGGAANSSPRHPNQSYLNSCLTAQPGYIDAATIYPGLQNGIRLVKAWKVTPVGTSFPIVMIADSTGAAYPVDVFYP